MEALDIEQLAKRDAAKNAQSAAEDAAKIKKRGYDDVVISEFAFCCFLMIPDESGLLLQIYAGPTCIVSSTDTVPNGKSDEENDKKARKV
uniref:tRNA(Phe) (4-demethylwyosine(37)-C(7)) aminocarboxypropyltransferase n=1 Tax=Ascaris lumbricoides TaxID=6252 RepID=A0A0M3HRX8_ASCLU